MKSSQVLKRIFKYTGKYSAMLILGLIFSAGGVAMTLYSPILIGEAVDMIIGPDNVNFGGIGKIAIQLAVVIAAGTVFQWLSTLCTNYVAFKTTRSMRVDIFRKLGTLPLKYSDTHSHGDILSRIIADIEQVSDGLLQGFAQFFSGIATIIGTIAFMFSVNAKIALVVIVLTPLSLFVAYFIAKNCQKMFVKQNKIRGELTGLAEEMISASKTVRAFSYEDISQERLEEVNSRLYDCGVKAQFFSAMTNPCTRFVNGVVFAAVAISGALTALSSTISVGQISSFLTYANQYTKPFNEITGVITELQNAFSCAARVFAVLDEESESNDSALPEITNCDGSVKIENLSFSYSPKKPLIENFNLIANPGQKTAIVGPTGCGKTTFINLLMRFYEPQEGVIKVSGIPANSVKRSSLRSCYGMVLQETWLFSGTVKENIAYARPDATDEEIISAAKLAHAHGFIKHLKDGYDTMITEDGGNLSQGQKQLLCIARIMLTSPPMLILDEATSSIDTRTEIKIQQAFDEMMKGRTSFIVAHRLSTIKTADTILVMRGGKIIEQGTHESLMAENGFYANLYNSQFEPSEE